MPPESMAKRKTKAVTEEEASAPTLLDSYVKKDSTTGQDDSQDVFINDDGTMQTGDSMQDDDF